MAVLKIDWTLFQYFIRPTKIETVCDAAYGEGIAWRQRRRGLGIDESLRHKKQERLRC